jgi:hypothetical protein
MEIQKIGTMHVMKEIIQTGSILQSLGPATGFRRLRIRKMTLSSINWRAYVSALQPTPDDTAIGCQP